MILGFPAFIESKTLGKEIPLVTGLNTTLLEDGTTVNLTWDVPKSFPYQSWVYGIYHGVRMEELVEGKYG